MSAAARSLAGAPDAPLHLAEHTLGSAALALAPLAPESPGESFLFLLGLPGAPIRCRSLGLGWQLEPDSLAWLRPAAPIHVCSASLRPATVLAWRFTSAALPAEIAELLLALPLGAAPLLGPRTLTPLESALVLGLRSCPVAASLRAFWAAAKLLELVTHLLPSPASAPAGNQGQADTPTVLPAPVRAALAHMEARLAESIGLAELAAAAGQSPAHFSRVFSEAIGRGPTAHLRRLRMDHAARLLAAGQANVTEAALAVGYQSLGQFSRVFSEHHGRPPSAFLPRKNG